MKYILGTVIAILCSFTCTDTLYGKSPATDVDDILIINTYTEANPWSNDFITSIVNMASQNSHIGVYTAHMKMLTLDEENKLETFKESLFKSYKNPKLIVLIGCGSFIMCDELNRQWPDIPMILCGERDYTGPKETMIREHLSLIHIFHTCHDSRRVCQIVSLQASDTRLRYPRTIIRVPVSYTHLLHP